MDDAPVDPIDLAARVATIEAEIDDLAVPLDLAEGQSLDDFVAASSNREHRRRGLLQVLPRVKRQLLEHRIAANEATLAVEGEAQSQLFEPLTKAEYALACAEADVRKVREELNAAHYRVDRAIDRVNKARADLEAFDAAVARGTADTRARNTADRPEYLMGWGTS
jgi:hypothetical protein